MKKVCLVVSKYLTKNKIFDASLHRDNCFDRFIQLKKAFELRGYDLSTHDINTVDDSDIVIYASNMPEVLPIDTKIGKSYLILSESAFIRPDNYDVEKHRNFKKIFTWSDHLVDGKKYIKLNYAHEFPKKINKDLKSKKKLCVLIAGNKKPISTLDESFLKFDLYSEREKVIRWFEVSYPQDFDLYGVGWDKYQFTGSKLIRALNKLPLLPKLMQVITGQLYPSYKGIVKQKKTIMEQYQFSICYENARDIPGYITEKIFDSFFAGCVPIYWGANNITDYIPESCFIDKRKFSNYENLYDFMKAMTESDYLNYLDNIEEYLRSDGAYPYKSECFVQVIIKTVFDDLEYRKK